MRIAGRHFVLHVAVLAEVAVMQWPCGLMDKALVFGTKDCRLESCQGHAQLTSSCYAHRRVLQLCDRHYTHPEALFYDILVTLYCAVVCVQNLGL